MIKGSSYLESLQAILHQVHLHSRRVAHWQVNLRIWCSENDLSYLGPSTVFLLGNSVNYSLDEIAKGKSVTWVVSMHNSVLDILWRLNKCPIEVVYSEA